MKCFANYDEAGRLTSLNRGIAGEVEITEEEYSRLLEWIVRVNEQAQQVFTGEIALSDVPAVDREEVMRRVEIMEETEAAQDGEISDTEALNIIMGGDA